MTGEREGTVMLAGEVTPLRPLLLFMESLQEERPALFDFFRDVSSSFSSSLSSSKANDSTDQCYMQPPPPPPPSSSLASSLDHEGDNVITALFRQIIRNDYRSYGKEMHDSMEKELDASAPPLPPDSWKEEESPTAEHEAYLLSMKLDEEEAALSAAREEAKVREMAERWANEDARLSKLFYCEICLDDEAPIDGAITLDCDHRFCQECLSGFICSKIESREIGEDELKCPSAECSVHIRHDIIKGSTVDVGKPNIYEKYLTFATDKYLEETIEAGAALRCPNESCNFVFQWHPDGSSLAFKCHNCSSEYCLNCALVEDESGSGRGIGPGHAPLSCEEQREKMRKEKEEQRKFDEWKKLNARAKELFEAMVKKNGWKSCPSCHCVIERTEGCDHMTCKTCKCNFCFICGKYDKSAPTKRGDCGMTCATKKKR